MGDGHSVTAYDLVVARLAEVTGHRVNGSGSARCPAHDDRDPSLSVTRADDRVLLKCQAGCDISNVLAALKLTAADLFDEPRAYGNREAPVATYRYVNEHGQLLFEVLRFPGKQFRQRRPDGNGGWVWKLGDAPRVLYHLPELVRARDEGRTIFVVEGEKDVHALEAAGEVATCNPGGAGKWRDNHTLELEGVAEVVIVRDKDPAGIKHAADVEAALAGRVGHLLIVEAKTGKDAADHLAAGHTVDEFETVGEHPPRGTDAQPTVFIDWSAFWAKDRRQAEWCFEDVLAWGRGHSLYAGHKVGKSLFTLYIVLRLIRDGIVVVYLDYEMSEDDLYDRLEDMGHGAHSDLSLLQYALLPSIAPLDTHDGAKELHALVDTVQAAHPERHVAVIIDTLGRAVVGEENSADTVRSFYRHTGIGLKQRGMTWARLDHAGKDPTQGQRGSSAKGDDVDIVWHLARTENGITLRREASRIGWVPERVAFRQVTDPLRFVRVAGDWPSGTTEVAERLNRADVPIDAGRPTARKMLADAGLDGGRNDVLAAALRYRRETLQDLSPHFGDSANEPSGTAKGDSE